jgi:4'-phosphopantetheinyl transferase
VNGPVVVIAPLPQVLPRGRERVELQRDHARRAVWASAAAQGSPIAELRKDSEDVPQPSRGWHWSLSHSPARVAGTVWPSSIGVDVEERRDIRPDLVDRILDAEELALFAARGEDGFLRTWTGKEALLKEFGVGLQALSRCRIVRVAAQELEMRFDDLPRIVHQRLFAVYLIVCVRLLSA